MRPVKTDHAHADQSLRFPPEDALNPWLPTECPSKTDQAAQMHRLILSLRWAHMQSGGKSYVPAQMVIKCIRPNGELGVHIVESNYCKFRK